MSQVSLFFINTGLYLILYPKSILSEALRTISYRLQGTASASHYTRFTKTVCENPIQNKASRIRNLAYSNGFWPVLCLFHMREISYYYYLFQRQHMRNPAA